VQQPRCKCGRYIKASYTNPDLCDHCIDKSLAPPHLNTDAEFLGDAITLPPTMVTLIERMERRRRKQRRVRVPAMAGPPYDAAEGGD
jgi:hypothetical protein